MKKTFSFIVILMMSVMIPQVSSGAESGPYFSTQFGMVFFTDMDLEESGDAGTIEYGQNYAVTVAGGYDFGRLRLEGELGYQTNEIDKFNMSSKGDCSHASTSSGDATAYSLLANLYFDFLNKTSVTPYLTAGMGMSKIEIDNASDPDYDDTVLAGQIGAGLAFAVNPDFTVELRYRYFLSDSPDFDGTEAEFSSHSVYLGFRVNF